MKISEIIEKIKEHHQPFDCPPKTRDLVLFGDPEIECTGICTTATPSMKVLKKCAEEGINFIVTHEGAKFNLEKGTPEDAEKNQVLQAKLKFLADHNMVIWRDHDHMHGSGGSFVKEGKKITIPRNRKDEIFYGTMMELGWEDYCIDDKLKPLWYKIPKTTTKELANFLMDKFHCDGVRIVGNKNAEIETVYFAEHVLGGMGGDVEKVNLCEKADCIIPFEIVDYTITQYVKDAAEMGLNKVIIEMGHFTSEELGMKYLVGTIEDIVDHKIPVKFIPAADTFGYITKEN